MTLNIKFIPAAWLVAAALLCLPVSCGDSHTSGEDGKEKTESGADSHDEHGEEIKMTPEAFKAAGIEVGTAEPGTFSVVVKGQGVIESPADGSATISAPASGIVKVREGIVPGAAVSAGERLFTVSSRGTAQADATAGLIAARDAAARELKRAEELLPDNLITRREYEQAKASYEAAKAAAAGVGAASSRGVAVASPMAGHIATLDVASGAFVEMGQPLATVAQTRRLVARIDVSERDRTRLAGVAGANLRVAGADETVSLADHGFRLLSVSPATQAGSHYVPVYVEFDNPGTFANGSVVEAWLLASPREGVITLPKSAIVEDGGLYYVYEEAHPSVFRKHEVTVGSTDGSRVEITSGLHGGERIAMSGALRIKMAGMGSAIPAHSHNH